MGFDDKVSFFKFFQSPAFTSFSSCESGGSVIKTFAFPGLYKDFCVKLYKERFILCLDVNLLCLCLKQSSVSLYMTVRIVKKRMMRRRLRMKKEASRKVSATCLSSARAWHSRRSHRSHGSPHSCARCRFLLQHCPVECVVVLVVQCAEQDPEARGMRR